MLVLVQVLASHRMMLDHRSRCRRGFRFKRKLEIKRLLTTVRLGPRVGRYRSHRLHPLNKDQIIAVRKALVLLMPRDTPLDSSRLYRLQSPRNRQLAC